MNIPRINVIIDPNKNLHRVFLYNEMLDFLKENHLRGTFNTGGYIRFDSMPVDLLKVLNNLKIEYKKGVNI